MYCYVGTYTGDRGPAGQLGWLAGTCTDMRVLTLVTGALLDSWAG